MWLAAAAAAATATMCTVDAASSPNILYIMADDLNNDWKNNRLDYMTNLRHYFRDNGAHFVNHVAAIPVCGPSRSSMLLGRYPHNTGYLSNGDLASVTAFVSKHNNTVGRWLGDAGYHSAFLGKVGTRALRRTVRAFMPDDNHRTIWYQLQCWTVVERSCSTQSLCPIRAHRMRQLFDDDVAAGCCHPSCCVCTRVICGAPTPVCQLVRGTRAVRVGTLGCVPADI